MARILVVDDEPDVRRIVGLVLRLAGHDMVEAVDGNQAVSVLEDDGQEVDAVVSDLNMPGLDGLHLRDIVEEQWPTLPFVLWSCAAGISHFAGRPVDRVVAKDPMGLDVDGLLAKNGARA